MELRKITILFTVFLFLTGNIFSQKEKEVSVKTASGKLYGSLLLPDTKETVPVVLIIPGSGPTDRNGNSALTQNNSYKMLAEELAKNNIASLRYDKQGIGASSDTKTEEKDLRFEDLVADVSSWIEFLKKNKKTGEIILIGHSEGSLVGILAAQENHIAKFISIAGPGRPIDEILAEQIAEQSEEYLPEVKATLEKLKKGDTVKNISPELYAIFRPSVQGYFISWLKYDPAEELKKLDIPHLIIQGTTDLQVKLENARQLNEAVEGDNLLIIENMNHVLKNAPSDRTENIKTYYDPKIPLHDSLVPAIVSFIK